MSPVQIPSPSGEIAGPTDPAMPSEGVIGAEGIIPGGGKDKVSKEPNNPKRKVVIEDSKTTGDGIKVTMESTDDADPRVDFLLGAFTQTLQ
jgi:hypothetical protein